MVCVVCGDTGLLFGEWCPLCEGFGHEDWLEMQHAQCPSHKGRLLVRRLTRVCYEYVSAEEKECIEELLLSKAQRKKRNSTSSLVDESCDAS